MTYQEQCFVNFVWHLQQNFNNTFVIATSAHYTDQSIASVESSPHTAWIVISWSSKLVRVSILLNLNMSNCSSAVQRRAIYVDYKLRFLFHSWILTTWGQQNPPESHVSIGMSFVRHNVLIIHYIYAPPQEKYSNYKTLIDIGCDIIFNTLIFIIFYPHLCDLNCVCSKGINLRQVEKIFTPKAPSVIFTEIIAKCFCVKTWH